MTIHIITELTPAQRENLWQLYQTTWWGKTRTLSDIEIMLQQSELVLGLCDDQSEKLIGFTRILTDYIYRAVIWDVMVDPAYQGQKLGQLLINTILQYPDLQKVEAFLLVCLPEMIPFYEKFGFIDYHDKLSLMIYSANF